MRNRPNTQEGGGTAVFAGSLKRRLKAIPLVIFNSTSETGNIDTNTRFRLLVKGLNGDLNVHIAVGIEGATGFVRPSDVPVGGANMQLTPINLFPDVAKKVYLREVFQDPTATDNANHPLPVDIPFGWEGSTEADQIEIEVNVIVVAGDESNPWQNTLINGRLVCEVCVEYNGSWWDVEAVQYALAQVTFEGGIDTLGTVETTVGGG
jgi:hypothetical protein